MKQDGYPAFFVPFVRHAGLFYFGFDSSDFTVERNLPKIKVPVLLIVAKKDETVGTTPAMFSKNIGINVQTWSPGESTNTLVDDLTYDYNYRLVNFVQAQ